MEGTNWVFNNNVFDGMPQINEGYLYKKGKIVRNWKLRWFVMDAEKGEVSVNKTTNKCCAANDLGSSRNGKKSFYIIYVSIWFSQVNTGFYMIQLSVYKMFAPPTFFPSFFFSPELDFLNNVDLTSLRFN